MGLTAETLVEESLNVADPIPAGGIFYDPLSSVRTGVGARWENDVWGSFSTQEIYNVSVTDDTGPGLVEKWVGDGSYDPSWVGLMGVADGSVIRPNNRCLK